MVTHSLLLVGLKGSGKTIIGSAYAQRLEFQCIDTDQKLTEIALSDGLELSNARELVERYGHRRFCYYEALATRWSVQQVREADSDRVIISAGGGLLENRLARRELHTLTPSPLDSKAQPHRPLWVVYLRADPDWLYDYYAREGLPSFLASARSPRQRWLQIVQRRSTRYQRYADVVVELGRVPLPAQLDTAVDIMESALRAATEQE